MGEKDDGLRLSLGLGLTLGHDKRQHPHQSSQSSSLNLKNLMQPLHENQNHNKSSLHDLFHSPGDKSIELRSFVRGIDVNRAPSGADIEDETGVSSPNSTVSSLSGKRSEREENEAERDSCSRGSDDEDGSGAARKKLRLTKEQSLVLEETFKEHNALNPKQKQALAQRLNLRPRQVEVWFQNRRARTKLKQTEVDCEYLKRCCENLTEENRRLQKEVQELRALKLSPQLYMHMNPPTTLTMCPSCERVAVTSQSSASSSAAASSSMAPAVPSLQNLASSSPQQPRPVNPWTALSMNNRMV